MRDFKLTVINFLYAQFIQISSPASRYICITNIVGILSVSRVFKTVNVQSETEFSRIQINKALKHDRHAHYFISFRYIQLTLLELHPSNTSPQHNIHNAVHLLFLTLQKCNVDTGMTNSKPIQTSIWNLFNSIEIIFYEFKLLARVLMVFYLQV